MRFIHSHDHHYASWLFSALVRHSSTGAVFAFNQTEYLLSADLYTYMNCRVLIELNVGIQTRERH